MPHTKALVIYTVTVSYAEWMNIVEPGWTVTKFWYFIQDSPELYVEYFMDSTEHEEYMYWRLVEGKEDEKTEWKRTALEESEIKRNFNRVRKSAGDPGV